jgi:hypothetical protein
MNEPRGRPVAKAVTGGLNARAKPSPLLVSPSSSTGGRPPPQILPPPSSLSGHPIRRKARPRKLHLRGGQGAGATAAAEDTKPPRKKNSALATISPLLPGPDGGRALARPYSSSLSSLSLASSSSSSSGARHRPRKPTDAGEVEEEGSVASRKSVETTEDNLTQDSSFSEEDNDLTRGSSYSVDDDDDDSYSDDCTNSYLSRDAPSRGPRRGRSKTGRGRQRSESDGGGGGRRRATVRGRGGEDYYHYNDDDDKGLSLLDVVSPCCSSLCVIQEGVNDLTRRWRRRARRATCAIDADDDVDDTSVEMRGDARIDSWDDCASGVSGRPASPPPDPPVTSRTKRLAYKIMLV